jgi:hypothetical protein
MTVHVRVTDPAGAELARWTTDDDGTHHAAALPTYSLAAADAVAEVHRARERFGPMRGAHEGYAVLLEEVQELWDEVRRNKFDLAAMRAEAVQVAAMALAFIVEVCDAGA